MEWIKKFIKNYPILSMMFPAGLGSFNFLGNLLIALSDGNIDGNELHQLMSSASGAELFLIFLIMIGLSKKRDKN